MKILEVGNCNVATWEPELLSCSLVEAVLIRTPSHDQGRIKGFKDCDSALGFVDNHFPLFQKVRFGGLNQLCFIPHENKQSPQTQNGDLQTEFVHFVHQIGLSTKSQYLVQFAMFIQAEASELKSKQLQKDTSSFLEREQESCVFQWHVSCLILFPEITGVACMNEVSPTVQSVQVNFVDTGGYQPLLASHTEEKKRKMFLSIKTCVPKHLHNIVHHLVRFVMGNMVYIAFELQKFRSKILCAYLWVIMVILMPYSAPLSKGWVGQSRRYNSYDDQGTYVILQYLHQAASHRKQQNLVIVIDNNRSCKRNLRVNCFLPHGGKWKPHSLFFSSFTDVLRKVPCLLRFRKDIGMRQPCSCRTALVPHGFSVLCHRLSFSKNESKKGICEILNSDLNVEAASDQVLAICIPKEFEFERLIHSRKQKLQEELCFSLPAQPLLLGTNQVSANQLLMISEIINKNIKDGGLNTTIFSLVL